MEKPESTSVAVALLNGEHPSKRLLSGEWQTADLRICADGAAGVCVKYGLVPHVVIGDFDSVSDEDRRKLEKSRFVHVPDQDHTDGEKVIQYCRDNGFGKIRVLGALGKRTDHSLYNIGLLKRFLNSDIELVFITESDSIRIIDRKTRLFGIAGQRISLLPVFGAATGVTSKGLRYPMKNVKLELGIMSSISNEFAGDTAEISLDSGELLLVLPNSPAIGIRD